MISPNGFLPFYWKFIFDNFATTSFLSIAFYVAENIKQWNDKTKLSVDESDNSFAHSSSKHIAVQVIII